MNDAWALTGKCLVTFALAGVLGACGGEGPTRARNGIAYDELTTGTTPPRGERISYGPDSLQFGEIRLPAGKTKVPIVVLIHGGCWRAEFDITHLSHAADALTHAGFATWTIEYRRVGNPGGGWPGTFTDVARGLDYTRQLGKRFSRLDTTRLVIVGHSAGGQLALWAASRKRGEHLDGVPVAAAPIAVTGVVSLAGITDLRSYGTGTGSCNRSVAALMGGTPAEFPERYSAVNPAERIPLGVRVRFVHGKQDSIVPLSESESMLALVRASGGDARLSAIESAGHFDLVAPVSAAWRDVLGAVRELAAGKRLANTSMERENKR